jgi:tetratricopeptide (TPR) repeat protein
LPKRTGESTDNAGKRWTKGDFSSASLSEINVYTAEKNSAAAENELKRSIETDEEYLPAYSAYASLLAARNQIRRSRRAIRKVVDKKPSAPVYTLLGILEEARGNSAEVEKNYRKALELAPDTPIAANNLAWFIAANNGGNLDEALQLAQKTVGKNPNVAGYYDTLGWIYYKKGLYSPAVEHLKKAVTLDESEAGEPIRQSTVISRASRNGARFDGR